jgi:hypothetical protein
MNQPKKEGLMPIRFRAALLLAASLVPAAAFADDVYLTNGRKFEGVIAEQTDSQVRIHMQGGVLSLPKSQVLRVEEGDSALSGYLQRKEALKRGVDTSAKDWLDLARWARTQGLEQAARESALAAAELDPQLEGLAPILRSFHYTYDEQLGRWISYDESMRRRGFVLSNGVWLSREEVAENARRRQEAEAEVARRRAEFEAARNARQTELLLTTQTALLEETLRERQQSTSWVSYPPYSWPVVVIPGFFPPRCPHGSCDPSPGGGDGGQPPTPPSHHRGDGHGGFIRIPGSLIPGRPGGMSSSPNP